MEVQGRAVPPPRRLNASAARAWAARWALLALATVVTTAAVVVDAQPVRSPWWTYADADASYVANSLNLLLDGRSGFLDHPGLTLTEATAAAFAVDTLFEEGSLSDDARRRYADAALLDLDSERGIFRGIAIACYLAGAVLSFALFARLFGHWTWGLGAGVLWLAAPGLVAMSIQLRPDVPLAVLTLVFAYAVGRALETREPATYAFAGALTGFTVMTKVHALGLLVPLVVAGLWRPPAGGWTAIGTGARKHVGLLAAFAVPWLALGLFFNGVQLPFTPTGEQLLALGAVLAGGAAVWGVGKVVSRLRALTLVGPSVAGGLLLPVSLDIPDGLQSLVIMGKTLLGQGVQEGVDSFAVPFSKLPSIVGPRVTVVLLLAAVAAVVGLARRDPQPVVWALGGAVMIVAAFARPPAVHYLAPGYVLAVPAMLWLLRRDGRSPAPLLIWPVVVLLAWPSFRDREGPTIEAERFAAAVEPTKRVVDSLLGPNEIALAPGGWPFADARYFDYAHRFLEAPPPYPFEYLSSTRTARAYADLRGLRPRFFISPVAQSVVGTQTIDVEEYGRFQVRRLPGTDLGLVLLAEAP